MRERERESESESGCVAWRVSCVYRELYFLSIVLTMLYIYNNYNNIYIIIIIRVGGAWWWPLVFGAQ